MKPRTRQALLGIALFLAMLGLLWRVMTSFAEGEHGIGDALLVVVALASGVLAADLVFVRSRKR